MPMIDKHQPGTLSWVDLSTTDLAVARSFYAGLLGWDVAPYDPAAGGGYFVGRVDGRRAGGLMEMSPELLGTGVPASWTPFFLVDDLDATVAAAEDEGGKVVQPAFAIPGGRIAGLADPTGAVFAVIEGPPEEGLGIWDEAGAPCWAEVLTRDVPAAEEFYSSLFGWTAQRSDSAKAAYTTFAAGDRPVAGMLPMPDAVPVEAPAHWMIYFRVSSCEAAIERARVLGGTVRMAPTHLEVGTFAVLEDPHGAVFSLFEHG